MFEDKTLSFIGSGIMAEAIIRGLLSQEIVGADSIIAAGPRPERGKDLEERHQIRVTTDNTLAAEEGQIVILSVKPQVLPEVMSEIRGHLRRQDLVISVIAGMPIVKIANGLAHAAVARAMPNTPAQIGQGITVWTVTPEVSNTQREQTRTILASLGKEEFVEDEDYLDMATAPAGGDIEPGGHVQPLHQHGSVEVGRVDRAMHDKPGLVARLLAGLGRPAAVVQQFADIGERRCRALEKKFLRLVAHVRQREAVGLQEKGPRIRGRTRMGRNREGACGTRENTTS